MCEGPTACSRRTAMLALVGLGGLPTDVGLGAPTGKTGGHLRAGAAVVDITPTSFPVIVNGGFLERRASRAIEPLHARCLVLDDGRRRIAIAVVDSVGMPRDMLDAVKEGVRSSTGIPTDHVLISATHTHSAPSVIGALGTDPDEGYSRALPALLVRGLEQANARLEPARLGWGRADAAAYTNCRRWIYRPDRVRNDPFGQPTVRAHMHPGHQNPNCIGPAGPTDPEITVLSVQSLDGRPIALLANYSMHYYGAPAVSSDYYGPFCTAVVRLLGARDCDPPPTVMMSQGTSGDLHWMDYGSPRRSWGDRVKYADLLAEAAVQTHGRIEHREDVTVAMLERRLALRRRTPDPERLAWARSVLAQMSGRTPKNQQQVYAREALYLHEEPARELKLQAIRIGAGAIAAIPNEVYGLTGLKIKARSPLVPTINITLANGCEGYVPPPEQHVLGGYTTWPARTAGLERGAEPAIVATVLDLLEQVSGERRRRVTDPGGPFVQAVLGSKPVAYWRLDEMAGRRARDAGGKGHHGEYEDGVAFHLPGPACPGLRVKGRTSRAAHFAGGRMTARLPALGDTYSVELWFWNGLPVDARPVTGYMFSRGPDGDVSCPGDHFGISGTHDDQGRLLFFNGNRANEALIGHTVLPLRTWNHTVLVREGERVTVYLNGSRTAEIASEAAATRPPDADFIVVGGRCDSFANWEGRIAEAAIYGRALGRGEIAGHYAASMGEPA